MNRTVLAVLAVFLAAAAGGAGLYVLTGEQTPANNSTGTATPTTATPTTLVPNTTATPTPTPDENESEPQRPPSNNSSDDQPKYVAMLSRILRSNSTRMASLDTPLPDNNTLHSGMVEIKSIEIEEYGSGTANDTRLRVEYYNTSKGLNEIRVISIVYNHVSNQSIMSPDNISFDEIKAVEYENHSSERPSGLLVIDEAWSLYYTSRDWDDSTIIKAITATADSYEDISSARNVEPFEDIRNQKLPQNVSLLRAEIYGSVLFVDYSTSTSPQLNQTRAIEMYKVIDSIGSELTRDKYSRVTDVFLEERYRSSPRTYDIRTWHMYNDTDVERISSKDPSSEIFDIIRKEIAYEADQIGK
ncbi:hypothetical protein ACFR9U_01680 [Halorientalis brevis]|uniref:Uncharacterized protein n=2 Tax=Halorientalis brevis TaxID=1126241 RepID=A0ABD6C5W2_9EURY